MKPKIITKDAFLVAGVSGSGDETAKAWEAFMKIQKLHPLQNQVGEEGYEIRLYTAEGTSKVHVGLQVTNATVPAEYKVFFVPAATYTEFEIYPSKGYDSSNGEMNKWLADNAGTYQEAQLDGMHYVIEVYDKRYKGDKDPVSVVGILMGVVKTDADAAANMMKMVIGPIEELAGRIEEFAGAAVSKKVMKGKDELFTAPDPVKGALWMKEVMDRLDNFTDMKTREQIMTACGCSCNTQNHKDTEEAKEIRRLCATEEEYLEKFLQPPGNGVRYERDGNTLLQYYTPRKYKPGLRCYCSLVSALPENMNASPTYCQCARAFTQAHWESVLSRPLKVELGKTAITGSDECKFIIQLK
jgi:predicted transcriptional regulator YdeE